MYGLDAWKFCFRETQSKTNSIGSIPPDTKKMFVPHFPSALDYGKYLQKNKIIIIKKIKIIKIMANNRVRLNKTC